VDLFSSEQLVLCSDPRVGLRAVIAVDDTTLGPSLGGVRYQAYPDELTAISEAQRLAACMTRKHALAGLPYGGGKSVIIDDGAAVDRQALMRTFGAFVARLGGTYVPAVDMGTSVPDLAEVAITAPDVACDHHDPSVTTSEGVFEAIRVAVGHVLDRDLAGVTVLVQGVGHVGEHLARLLADAGARVTLADIDGRRAAALAAEIGATAVTVDELLSVDCDVFAPCAIARVINPSSIPQLRCRIVAGGANDPLSDPSDADALAQRGIVYIPDFVANAGGVIHVHSTRADWDEDRIRAEVLSLGDRVGKLLSQASDSGQTPLQAAEEMAARRIAEHRVATT
jgi:leucine dehydrogenase